MASDREIDPLLKDLDEKNQSLRRNVLSLAMEVKDGRCTQLARLTANIYSSFIITYIYYV